MNKKKINTIGITGAAGFVGRHLVRTIRNSRSNIRIKVLLNRTDLRDNNVEKTFASVTDREKIREFVKDCDAVIHLATALGNRQISDREFEDINVKGSRNLAEAAYENKVKYFVHFSSAGVYGKSSGMIPLKEDSPLNPVDIYERTKLEGEKAVLKFREKLSLLIIRPGWIYGPEDRRTFKLIRQINSGLFFIAGKGDKLQTPVHVRDLCEATLSLMENSVTGTFNCASEPLSVEKMVKTISSVLKKKILPFKIPLFMLLLPAFILEKLFALIKKEAPLTRAKLAFFMRGKPLDSSKLKNISSIKIERDFRSGIKEAVDWYKKEKWI